MRRYFEVKDMKKLLLMIILSLLVAPAISAQTDLVFGIKPGLGLNSAYLGIRQGKFLPYTGVDLIRIGVDGSFDQIEEKYQAFNTFTQLKQSYSFSAKAFLLIPQAGGKFFLSQNSARPYLFGSVFLSLPMVTLSATKIEENWEYLNGQLAAHQRESLPLGAVTALEKTIQEALSFWGINLGAGAEYFFSPQFSLGGEYGIRLIFDQASYDGPVGTNIWPASDAYDHLKAEAKACLQISYAVLTINFYF